MIGASSAHRWMNCPGSVRLCSAAETPAPSLAASTGTAAHEVAESLLRDALSGGSSRASDYTGAEILADGRRIPFTDRLAEAVQTYADTVLGDWRALGGDLRVEESFDLGWLQEGLFGRNDAMLLPAEGSGRLTVYDYKNGRHPVMAERNPQAMYYALGAVGESNPLGIEMVELVIVQPNAPRRRSVDRWSLSVEDLYGWAYGELLPAAKATRLPDAPCVEGEWCFFCTAKDMCPARRRAVIGMFDDLGPGGAPVEGRATEAAVIRPGRVAGKSVEDRIHALFEEMED